MKGNDMKAKTVSKSPHALEVGEKTLIHKGGRFDGVSIARTRKGWRAELPGFVGVTVSNLGSLMDKEITRVRTRGGK